MTQLTARADERQMLIATFKNHDNADHAYDAAVDREGYAEDDISVLMSDATRKRYFGDREHVEIKEGTKAAEGAGIGGALGGATGGVAGALVAAGGMVTFPGLGLAIAGPLAAALAGAGTGGGAGSVVGALIGAGVTEERAKRYETDIKEGGIVLGVVPRSERDAEYFETKWKEFSTERVFYEASGAWELFASRLCETYSELDRNALSRYRGQRAELVDYLLQKTGDSRNTIERHINEAATEANYSFTAGSSETTTASGEATTASDGKTAASGIMSSSTTNAKGQWTQFKGKLRETYGSLTDDAIEQHKGQREQLIGYIQQETGRPHSEVQATVDRAANETSYTF